MKPLSSGWALAISVRLISLILCNNELQSIIFLVGCISSQFNPNWFALYDCNDIWTQMIQVFLCLRIPVDSNVLLQSLQITKWNT